MTDRRSLFATGRIAAEELRGTVEAEHFVSPWKCSVAKPTTFLHSAPGGPRDREMVFGDRIELIEERGGWSFGRAARDGYCGWFDSSDLGPEIVPTHAVRVRRTHIYPEPQMKLPPLMRLSFASLVRVDGFERKWAATPEGYIFAAHLRETGTPMWDPVAVAEMFLGTPYLWAGNTGEGIDCSGLIQMACLACGVPCPGDSDQQNEMLGETLSEDAELRRGDLLFWRSHAAWVSEVGTILHANAYRMMVNYEPLQAAIERIEAQGDGPVTSRRRL